METLPIPTSIVILWMGVVGSLVATHLILADGLVALQTTSIVAGLSMPWCSS